MIGGGVQQSNYAYWKNPHPDPSLIRIKQASIWGDASLSWPSINSDVSQIEQWLFANAHLLCRRTCPVFTVKNWHSGNDTGICWGSTLPTGWVREWQRFTWDVFLIKTTIDARWEQIMRWFVKCIHNSFMAPYKDRDLCSCCTLPAHGSIGRT